jgi:uncharacterized protein
MLSYNVAGLLRSAPGTARRYTVHESVLEIAADVRLAAPIEGEVRLSHTGRGILATAELTTALEEHCSRCLVSMAAPIRLWVEEEALPSVDLETGRLIDPSAEPEALRLDDHHELDLAQPIREAIFMAEPIAPLCRPDCLGLCAVCGAELNAAPDHDHGTVPVDPRLASLADWRAPGNAG